MVLILPLLGVLAAAVVQTHAKLFDNPIQLPPHKHYDYIVVGAGPGGCVVANRLSENPHTNVLLIEAGPRCVIRISQS